MIFNLEVIEQTLIEVLCCKTSIHQITFNMIPFVQSSIIKHLQLVCDDERNNTIA